MLTEKKLYELYSSGFVNRYHSHPNPLLRNSQDITDGHSNRMVKLLLGIFPEEARNPDVLTYIVMHDAGEVLSGDGPFSAKQASPELKSALDVLEHSKLSEFYECFHKATLLELPEFELLVVKLLDLLESLLFQIIYAPQYVVVETWLYRDILNRALVLGVYGKVLGLLAVAMKVNNVKMIDEVI